MKGFSFVMTGVLALFVVVSLPIWGCRRNRTPARQPNNNKMKAVLVYPIPLFARILNGNRQSLVPARSDLIRFC